jgi:hypothetical protein
VATQILHVASGLQAVTNEPLELGFWHFEWGCIINTPTDSVLIGVFVYYVLTNIVTTWNLKDGTDQFNTICVSGNYTDMD